MNNQFHYFAVKYLAGMAYFDEKQSQKIAEISQFIDDNKNTLNVVVAKDKIPLEFFDWKLADIDKNTNKAYVIFPKTQAASKEDLAAEDVQYNCMVPFHYIPKKYRISEMIEIAEGDAPYPYDFRTSGINDINNHRLFTPLSRNAEFMYQKAIDKPNAFIAEAELSEALIRMGILTHIIADSFYHKGLVGNNSYLAQLVSIDVKNNVNGDSVKADYPAGVSDAGDFKKWHVGDWCLEGLFDACGIRGTVFQNDELGLFQNTITFNATDSAIGAAKSIYQFLLSCSGNYFDDYYESVFKHTIVPALNKLLRYSKTSNEQLCRNWENETKFKYSYKYDSVMEAFKKTPDDVVAFTGAVYDVRLQIVGNIDVEANPLKVKGDSNEPEVSVSAVRYEGDKFAFDIDAAYESEQDNFYVDYKLQDMFETVSSETKRYGNTTAARTTVACLVQEQTKEYKLVVSVGNEEKLNQPTILRQTIQIVSPESMFKITYQPSRSWDSSMVVANNYSDKKAAVSNLDNAVYIAQDNVPTLDLYVPFEAFVTVDESYRFNKVDDCILTLFDKKKNTYLRHCQNKGINLIEIENYGSVLHLKFNKEWKNRIFVKDYMDGEARFTFGVLIKGTLENAKAGNSCRKFEWDSRKAAQQSVKLPEVVMKWRH